MQIQTREKRRFGKPFITKFGTITFDSNGIATVIPGMTMADVNDVFPDAVLYVPTVTDEIIPELGGKTIEELIEIASQIQRSGESIFGRFTRDQLTDFIVCNLGHEEDEGS